MHSLSLGLCIVRKTEKKKSGTITDIFNLLLSLFQYLKSCLPTVTYFRFPLSNLRSINVLTSEICTLYLYSCVILNIKISTLSLLSSVMINWSLLWFNSKFHFYEGQYKTYRHKRKFEIKELMVLLIKWAEYNDVRLECRLPIFIFGVEFCGWQYLKMWEGLRRKLLFLIQL